MKYIYNILLIIRIASFKQEQRNLIDLKYVHLIFF